MENTGAGRTLCPSQGSTQSASENYHIEYFAVIDDSDSECVTLWRKRMKELESFTCSGMPRELARKRRL